MVGVRDGRRTEMEWARAGRRSVQGILNFEGVSKHVTSFQNSKSFSPTPKQPKVTRFTSLLNCSDNWNDVGGVGTMAWAQSEGATMLLIGQHNRGVRGALISSRKHEWERARVGAMLFGYNLKFRQIWFLW